MRRALLGVCLVAAIYVASVFGQQPDDFGKKGGQDFGKRGGKAIRGGKVFNDGTPKPDAPQTHRWEYNVRRPAELEEIGDGDLQRGLNRLGESGWELVGIFGSGRGHAYFKRPRNGAPLHADEDSLRNQPPAPPMPPGDFGGGGRLPANPVPPVNEMTTIVSLKNSEAVSVAQILSSIYRNRGPRFIPDGRTNRLILIAPDDKLAEIRKFIEELDQPIKSGAMMKK